MLASFRGRISNAFDETNANIASRLRGDALELFEKQSEEWRRGSNTLEPQQLKDKEERYKKRHTVYLKDYLQYPYRKLVANPLEGRSSYQTVGRRVSPKIKTILEGASHSQPKNYEF